MNPYRYEDHGTHYCGGTILYNKDEDLHICGDGVHEDNDLVIEDCESCHENEDGLDEQYVIEV